MKSGMIAAEAVFEQLKPTETENSSNSEVSTYRILFEKSWLFSELYSVRNVRPAFKWGLLPAMAYTALEQYVFKGNTPWTIRHHGTDHGSLKKPNNLNQLIIQSQIM